MEGIASLFLIIGFIVYFNVADKIIENRVDNYDTKNVDSMMMFTNKMDNNLSDRQVARNMVNGKYDKR